VRGAGIVALAVLVSVLTSVIGCTDGPATLISGPLKITFWHRQTGEAARVLDELCAEFSRTEPNITVTPVGKGRGETLAGDLQAAVSAGRGPVVAEVNEQDLAVLRAVGSIRPLQSFITNVYYGLRVDDLDDFWPFVKANTVGRQVWGLPFSYRIYALVYDPAVVDSPPVTWEDLKRTASALTCRDPDPARSTFGLAFRPDTDLFTVFLHQNGGQLLAGDPAHAAFNSPEAVACLEYLYEITTLRKSVLLTVGDPLEAVVGGRAAMAICPVGWAPVSPPLRVALAPLPVGQKRATLTPGTSLVLAAGRTPVEEEAGWRFIRWLSQPANAARWAVATGNMPIRRSAMDQPVWRYGPGVTPGWWAVVSQMDDALILPWAPELARINAELTPAISAYLLGEISSPQTLLEDVVKRVNRSGGGP
jgi:multiple sugar transport system substrate-binding protein